MRDFLTKLRLSVQFIGLRAVLRTIIYAIYRDIQDIGYNKSLKRIKSPGILVSVQETSNGAMLEFEAGIYAEVSVVAENGVCVTWLPGRLPYSGFLENLVKLGGNGRDNSMAMRIIDDSDKRSVVFEMTQITLIVRSNGGIEIQNANGEMVASAQPPTLHGKSWQYSSHLKPQERIFGLGMRAAELDLTKRRYALWNTDPSGSYGPGHDPLYLNIPVYIGVNSSGSYLVFFENTHRSEVDLREKDRLYARFESGSLRLYFFTGSLPDLCSSYTGLTGRPDLPPRWALGFHHCRWGYRTEEELREVLAGFEQNALPVQALHQDIDYMDGFRVFTVNKEAYPSLPGLIREMAMRDVKLVAIIDPGVKVDPAYEVYKSGFTSGAFVKQKNGREITRSLVWPGWCAFPDFTSGKVRDWWGSYYARLLDQGVAGIWHDMNEPACFAAWGDLTLPLSSRHDFDGNPGDHSEAHNIYGSLMNRAGYDALKKLEPDRRPWLLSRSGWSGSQKYAWHWTADIESSWEALRLSIPMLINLGLSGFAYSGTDIGGFSGNPDGELFTRWFQMASFTPFFRNHAARGTHPREPWVYGEPYTTIIRSFIELRLKLLPYWYTLSSETADTGYPLIRPLFWTGAKDPELFDVEDAFQLGNDLLIAPVCIPGCTRRTVVLPDGGWYDFWDNAFFHGPAQISAATPLERIPIYVRAGAILPLEEDGNLVLHIYPDHTGTASGRIYYDRGDGYGSSGEANAYFGNDRVVRISTSGEFLFPWKTIRPVLAGDSAIVQVERNSRA